MIDNYTKVPFTLLQNKNEGARLILVLWAFVGVAPFWNKLALRMNLKNLYAKSQLSSFYSFRDLSVHTDRQTDRRTLVDLLG